MINLLLLNEPINRYILAMPWESLRMVMRRLTKADGEAWWHLVVELGDKRFAATQFRTLVSLAKLEGNTIFDYSLDNLMERVPIPEVRVVERSEIGTEAAKDLADESPGQVLVVTQGGEFFRILFRGKAGGSVEDGSWLSQFQEALPTMPLEEAPPEEEYTSSPEQPSDQERYIQVQVTESTNDTEHLSGGTPLMADQEYKLNVRIGLPDPEWLGPPPEKGVVWPDGELPQTESIYRIQVAFVEPFHAPEPQMQTLLLPRRGYSAPIHFQFHTLPNRPEFEARIVMLYENRILQTALLRSRVTPADHTILEQGQVGLHLVIEAKVRNRFSKLEEGQKYDAAVVLNHTQNGEASMHAFTGESALVIALSGVQREINAIKEELSKIYRTPDRFNDGLWGIDSQELLFQLAIVGNKLHKKLLQFQGLADHPIIKNDRLQIVTANVASFLPLEYIYDRQPPSLDLNPAERLCAKEKAEECLTSGKCRCDQSESVCPMGFWGMHKVIERFAFKRPLDDQSLQGDVFKVYAGINDSNEELKPFQRVLYAASKKVDEHKKHSGQIQAVLDTLQQASRHNAHMVSEWIKWREDVVLNHPTLLVLLPHHTIHPQISNIHGLEIDTAQCLWDCDVKDQDVHASGSDERPIVFLLGCETMSVETLDESFVAEFLSRGAAIVLGTTTSVLGYHVAPVACKLVELMQAVMAEGTNSFAEVMLRVRRQALLEGYPMVLTLFAYGDAGWKLAHAKEKEVNYVPHKDATSALW